MAEEEERAVGETTVASDDRRHGSIPGDEGPSLDDSYQLDFDCESPVRPPRRWSSLNSNNSAPQMMSASASNLFKSPKRSISSSGATHLTHQSTATSFHDSMSHMHSTATATTSSGGFLRSNFKAQTKSTSSTASQWQLPTAAAAATGSGGATPDWMRKLKHSKGGDAEPAATPHQNATDETLPEWKKKFLEMKGGSSSAVTEDKGSEKTGSSAARQTEQAKPNTAAPEVESHQTQSRGASAASATPEWKRKFLQMKIATDAAQLHEEETLIPPAGDGRNGDGGSARSDDGAPASPSSLPTWKKSIAKRRHVQAELLSLGLRESKAKAVEHSDAVPTKVKGPSGSKDNDGTPEWMKKFQSMKFEKEESVIEAGGKQDPGVVTNGNGVVVSWARSTTTQTKTTTTVMDETESNQSLGTSTKVKSRRVEVSVERETPDSSCVKPIASRVRSKSDSSDRPTTATSDEIFCQLCDRKGHSAKECPQLLAPQREPVDTGEDGVPMTRTPSFESNPPILDEHAKEKTKKKKSKPTQELAETEEIAVFNGPNVAADIEATNTDVDLTLGRNLSCTYETATEPGKKKKKKKKLADSEAAEEIDHTASTSQLIAGSVEAPAALEGAGVSLTAHDQDNAVAEAIPKKKRKKKAAASVECDSVVENFPPALAVDEPSSQVPAMEAPLATAAEGFDAHSVMNESFSISELSSDPTAKTKRKKKTARIVESDDCIGEITCDSQSEVSKAGVATEATAPMNESYSSTGESSTDLNSRDRTSRMRKTRRKKQGKDEPAAGRTNDSCSSLESSVVSSPVTRPMTGNSEVGEGRTRSTSRSASKSESHNQRDEEGELDGPDTSSTSQQSSVASSRGSTHSSKCSSSKQEGPLDASRAAKDRILEERIQIVNTLNAFLDQTKERMANRESRIPEGSLRANRDDGKASHQQDRRASVGVCTNPTEEKSRTTTKKSKPQSTSRVPHRRRSCTGGSGTQSAPVKRDGSRRTEVNVQPPSSPRRRPGQNNLAQARRRVARDPEPDLKPSKAETDTSSDDVFRVVSHNASFQMSRQKICLPTDFDDFDEADLSDGNSGHGAAVKSDNADPFDDGFGCMVSTDTFFEVTDTVSSFQTVSITSTAIDSFEREITSADFEFSSFDDIGKRGDGTDDFSVDPFGQSGMFDAGEKTTDLTENFADASSSFWGSTSNEPTIERRRSVDTSSSSTSAAKQQRRRNGEAPTRLSRRRSSTAGRSNSFHATR